MMGKPLILFAALLLCGSIQAQDRNYSDCLVKAGSSWGKTCEKCETYKGYKRDYSGVYQVEFKNVCPEIIQVKVAMEEADGHWRTFPVKTLDGGKTMVAFACKGTGKYLYWARRADNTEIILPTDRDIAAAYSGH